MDWAEAAYGDLAMRRADHRPYVAVNMVASADGAIAVEGRTAKLGGPSDHHLFHYLRSLADVILVGAQTVRAERYGPPRVSDEHRAQRAERGQQPLPRIAIVSRSLDLDLSAPLFTTEAARPIVLAPASADAERRALVGAAADLVIAGDESVDPQAALAALHELGAGFVLCEGGPTLNGELAKADVLDELCLTVSAALVGGTNTGIVRGGLGGLLELSLVHARVRDDDVFLRYRRADRPVAPDERVVADTSAFDRIVGDLDEPMMIVTTSAAGERSGCLVGFGTQASIHPGRFVIELSKANHTYGVAIRAEVLAVHFPSADDRRLAELFGARTGDEVDKFSLCAWHDGPLGAPVLDGVARWFVGRVLDRIDTGDHVAFVLAPVAAEAGPWSRQLGLQDVRDIDPGHPA